MKDQEFTLQTNIEVYSGEMKIVSTVWKTIRGEGDDLRMGKGHFAHGGHSEDR